MYKVLEIDPEFIESKFITFVDNVFIQIHLALMIQDLEKIKHFVNEEVYRVFDEKLKSLQNRQVKQIYDEINVKNTTIIDAVLVDNKIQIKVKIVSRYMDYLIDNNGKFVSGINTHRIEKDNYLIFEKDVNAKGQESARRCPGCGANINVNGNGKCAYCGSIYNLKDKDWLLISLETID